MHIINRYQSIRPGSNVVSCAVVHKATAIVSLYHPLQSYSHLKARQTSSQSPPLGLQHQVQHVQLNSRNPLSSALQSVVRTCNSRSPVTAHISAGILPVNRLSLNSAVRRSVIRAISEGICPTNSLPSRRKKSNFIISAIDGLIVPFKLLE